MLIKQTAKHVEFAIALMQKVADGKMSAVTFGISLNRALEGRDYLEDRQRRVYCHKLS